jgi:hypothetical protein
MKTWSFLRLFLSLVALVCFSTSRSPVAPLDPPSYITGLRGEVRAGGTRQPLAGARVSAPDLNLAATTDASGRFAWNDIRLDRPAVPVTVTISAPGYGDWSVANLLLVAGDTLILTPEIEKFPVRKTLPSSGELRPSPAQAAKKRAIAGLIPSMTEWVPEPQAFTIPQTIRVRITGKWECDLTAPYSLVTVDFKHYVKHVLPNEWYYFWPRESLKAGAVAVKTYAWYFIEQGGKWDDADVLDNTCDQWYVPFLARESTNQAVDQTWHWLMTRAGQLFPAYHKDILACDPPACMRQSVSARLAREGSVWNEILQHFYGQIDMALLDLPPAGHALQFDGLPGDSQEANRLQIAVGGPPDSLDSPLANVGNGDFTIEWWMKARATENRAAPVRCGTNGNWIFGNILLDRYRPGRQPGFGVSLAGGAPVFGVTGKSGRSLTICSTISVADGRWHHLAVQRQASDGFLWLFVDGRLVAQGDGPDGAIGYPAGYISDYPDREPFLSLGGWKMDTDHKQHPFYRGWIDELRFSNGLRYSEAFEPPQEIFQVDDATLGLYRFDEGIGEFALGDTGTGVEPGVGTLLFGGLERGPQWFPSDLFVQSWQTFLPSVSQGSKETRP